MWEQFKLILVGQSLERRLMGARSFPWTGTSPPCAHAPTPSDLGFTRSEGGGSDRTWISSSGEICDLADKYEAQVFVDECHATGFLGQSLEVALEGHPHACPCGSPGSSGRGTPELCGVAGQGLGAWITSPTLRSRLSRHFPCAEIAWTSSTAPSEKPWAAPRAATRRDRRPPREAKQGSREELERS